MNEQFKNITVNGETLESFLSEEDTKEHFEESKSEIISMDKARKKRRAKTRMQSHYDQRAKTIYKEKKMDTLTMEELRQIINSHSLVGAALFLLSEEYEVNGTWFATQLSEARGRDIPQGQANQALRQLRKSSIGHMIEVQTKDNRKNHTLMEQYLSINWKDLYKVYNNRFPDTITDLKRKYPNAFPVEQFKTMTTEEEAKEIAKDTLESEMSVRNSMAINNMVGIEKCIEYSKCPRCQQKALSNEGICEACGYNIDNGYDDDQVPEEETIPDKFDAFTKDVINKALKDKFGQDINVNVNIHITFGLKQ